MRRAARTGAAGALALAIAAAGVAAGREARYAAAPPRGQAPRALGCGVPCTTGNLTASGSLYDVVVDCDLGRFTARTNAGHPLGAGQDVLQGGGAGLPATSRIAFAVYGPGVIYEDPPGGSACTFDPPDMPAEPASVGVEQEWTVSPAPGISLVLRQEVVAFGTSASDAGVRLTLGATSAVTSTASVGMAVRWELDHANGGDDGPDWSTLTCPATTCCARSTEHDVPQGEIQDYYSALGAGAPAYAVNVSTSALAGIAGTGTPDRLVYGPRASLSGSPFDYTATEGASATDSMALYYYGYDMPTVTLHPGETFRRSVVLTAGAADCGALGRSCPVRCTTALAATGALYDAYLDCSRGRFTAATAAGHPLGPGLDVIYAGAMAHPGTSTVAWHVHDTGATYEEPAFGAACPFDPPDTPAEPGSVGVQEEWVVSPAAGIDLVLREEAVTFGASPADSGVRFSLGAANAPTSTAAVTVGVRWEIDHRVGTDDGPDWWAVTCPGTACCQRATEHDFQPSELQDFYSVRGSTGTIYSVDVSTGPVRDFPGTGAPDRLVYGYWPRLRDAAWDYVATEGAAASDAAVLYYYGYRPAAAVTLQPGESFLRSIVMLAGAASDCGGFTPGCSAVVTVPPAEPTICVGDSAVLDASGLGVAGCTDPVDYAWTDPGGAPVGTGPTVTVTPASSTTYSVHVSCSTAPACAFDRDVAVSVHEPPSFAGVRAVDASSCAAGIDVSWDAAVFRDPTGGGTYTVHRSEVSCADALLRPPLVNGLAALSWSDATTLAGATYYYAVEAEDATPGCSPRGPTNGGLFADACAAAPITDVAPPPPPGVFAVLFATHAGDAVTLDWPLSRPLLAGEHFHLLQAHGRGASVARINPEGDVGRGYTGTDTSSPIQFFDLRVADACEAESLPDYPPGLP